jgi:hypothetical protein|tara:strand:+ start:494 stop:688 length:195 start_codon:yes stop_codon:yes gene_type:complete
MSSDQSNSILWIVTRKRNGRTEYLISATKWSLDPRFAKMFDTQRGTKAFLKANNIKGSVRRHEL